mgnify:CR=1 FL=1
MSATTTNKTIETEQPKRRFWRPRKMWEWATQNRNVFKNIFPDFVIDAAMATCTLELRSKDYSGGQCWGREVIVDMQTYGFFPSGLVSLGVSIQETSRHWIQTTSIDAANLVLSCFGLTMQDVWNHFDIPANTGKLKMSLFEIVTELCGAETKVPVVV